MAPHVQGARMVSLLDGSLTWSDSEAWRNETLARSLLSDYPPGATDDVLHYIEGEWPELAIELRGTMRAIREKARAA